jgi:hypothetical protein
MSHRERIKKIGFTPIELDDYIALRLRANPVETRTELVRQLRSAVDVHRAGVRRPCGEPISVVASSRAGRGCVTCITGEFVPHGDYEIVIAADRT